MSDNSESKKRKVKWEQSYSRISRIDAEKRLGVEMETLDNEAIPVSKMLAEAGYTIEENNKGIQEAKRQVYKAILQYLDLEGYPTETNPDYNGNNVRDLVLYILGPLVSYFKRNHVQVGRNIRLRREKQIVFADDETSGNEEFIMMDQVCVTERYCVIVIGAKRSSLGEAFKWCLLSMRDTRDSNDAGNLSQRVKVGR